MGTVIRILGAIFLRDELIDVFKILSTLENVDPDECLENDPWTLGCSTIISHD